MISCSREILDSIEKIRKAAAKEPENLGHQVKKLTTNSKLKINILALTKWLSKTKLMLLVVLEIVMTSHPDPISKAVSLTLKSLHTHQCNRPIYTSSCSGNYQL